MFNEVHLQNFGAFSKFDWPNLGRVNVIVGENDTGKSHLLKVMYVVAKLIEARPKVEGDEEISWKAMLLDKLRWTFQPRGMLRLIRHDARKARVDVTLVAHPFSFVIQRVPPPPGRGRSTYAVHIPTSEFDIATTEMPAIFVPPKEILSTFSAIAATRETLEIFGFDDTYYDLIKQLRVPPTQGKIDPKLIKVLDDLRELFGGKIVKGQTSDEFMFERGKRSYGMPQTADGIKKIGILANLIENRTLKKNSILFLDEPETNLHPKAITYLTKMLFSMAQAGVQVFLATHNYLVIKQLQILAQKYGESVPFCSLVRSDDDVVATLADLRDGMPENPIVEESVRLYREELEADFQVSKKS